MREIIHCALLELKRRLLRSLTLGAGYFLGCVFLVLMMLLLNHEITAKSGIINYMGTHFMAFAAVPYADDGFVTQEKMPLDQTNEAFFAEPMVVTRLLPKDLADKMTALPEVLAATPFLLFRMKQSEDGHMFSIGGFHPGDEAALKGTATSKKDIVSGAFLSSEDRNVVLVEETYALMWNLKPGSVVNIGDKLFPVIGVVKPGVKPVRADIFMNWADAESVINSRISAPLNNEANIFLVESAGIDNHEAAMKKVSEILPGGIINTFNCSIPAIEVLGISTRGMFFIGGLVMAMLFLVSAGSQWAVVCERHFDIAVLKAIGWKNASVVWQLLCESVILAVLGCFAGIPTGFILYMPVSQRVFSGSQVWPAVGLSAMAVLLVMILFVITAVLSSLPPVLKATATRPAELLRRS